MENNITVNMDNLSTDERNTLLKLIEKSIKPKNKVWKPEIGEDYYCINSDSNKMISYYHWQNDVYDKHYYETGNCFKTKEEAEFALEKQKVITELKRFALENNECELDWYDYDQEKYYIKYACQHDYFSIHHNCGIKCPVTIYFSSEDIAKQAIKTIGEDRLKKYYFEVNDNEQTRNFRSIFKTNRRSIRMES